jgi:hypothetical protein
MAFDFDSQILMDHHFEALAVLMAESGIAVYLRLGHISWVVD